MNAKDIFIDGVVGIDKQVEGAPLSVKCNGKNLTHEDFLARVDAEGKSMVVLSTYVDARTRIRCRCNICGFEWETFPRNLYAGKGCPKLRSHGPTNDEFVSMVAEKPQSIELTGEYVDKKTTIGCKCKVCGFTWSSLPDTILNGSGCISCLKRTRTHDSLVSDIAKLSPSVELIGKYVDAKTKIKCRCKDCGNEWSTSSSVLLRGGSCPECSRKKSAIKRTKSHEAFVAEIAKISPSVEIVGTYKGEKERIECRCKTCGKEWKTAPTGLSKGTGCPVCGIEKNAAARRRSNEQFVSELAVINSNITVIGKYVSAKKGLECQCNRCGHKWFPKPANLLKGTGCPSCANTQTSFLEKYIFLALRDALGNDKVLPRDKLAVGQELDIYMPHPINIAIEPGGWHWHQSRVEEDKEKEEICRKHGIKLVTIYDSFSGDRDALGLDDSFITYEVNLGMSYNNSALRECLVNVFNIVGINYSFTEVEEKELFDRAKIASRKKTTKDIVDELAKVNEDIELIGEYKDSDTQIECRCKKCGHEFKRTTNQLLREKSGCPICKDLIKRVVNLDTGEIFESIAEAGRRLNISCTSISAVCRGINKTCGGYHFAYLKSLTSEQIEKMRRMHPNTVNY